MNDELRSLVRTFEALGPIVGNAVKSGQLFKPQCELTEPDPDILCEYDVKTPMSEGFSVTTNIYRPRMRSIGNALFCPRQNNWGQTALH